jgi:hypothetical protein
MEFITTDGGIAIPRPEPEKQLQDELKFPVRAGWNYSKCGDRYYKSDDAVFRMQALEALYIAVSPGGGRVVIGEDADRRKRLTTLIDQLAVELVGGVPEGFEEYT